MFKKLGSKLKKGGKVGGRRSSSPGSPGAAVPYTEASDANPPSPDDDDFDPRRDSGAGLVYNNSSPTKGFGGSRKSARNGAAPDPEKLKVDGRMLTEATKKGDMDALRRLLKDSLLDINAPDQHGNTSLHLAASNGNSKLVRYLLLHGADVDCKTKKGRSTLYLAVEGGHTGTVGVLLDFMHSVDTRMREPFIMLRARRYSDGCFFVERSSSCAQLRSFRERDTDHIQIFIAHAQRAPDMAEFLYSTLDVQVKHAFFQNAAGDLNMRNFQRFEDKTWSQSLTILNTAVRVMEPVGYDQLKSLILVSCELVKLTLEGLVNLELLDVRFNCLENIPDSIKDCINLKTIRVSHNHIKRIPQEIGLLKHLTALEASHNGVRRISTNIVRCSALRLLALSCNELLELPVDIGLLENLEELFVQNNKLSVLPLSISALINLKRIRFCANPLTNIPVDFPERAAEVREYLNSLQDDPTPNRTVKLVLVGQEGVGKSTLLTAIKRTLWVIPRTPNTPKTEGITVKNIQVDDLTFRCFDCGGDVDFNETHNFFITQGALYLACFNLAEYTRATVEKNSFLLGRLQLWLQYIFSKVPSARVIIVGTHADSDTLSRPIFEQIWEQLRTLLVSAREHHQQYFRKNHRHSDCLLCQSDSKCLRRATGEGPGFVNLGYDDSTSLEDETSFNEGPARVVSFPHIVGYYEVSSVKSMGNDNIFQIGQNKSIELLKDAVVEVGRKLTQTNPDIPRKWANVLESLQECIRNDPDNSVTSLDEVAKMAAAQGVHKEAELNNMLHFLKAQGNLLFFPESEHLSKLVVLDPEWLAKIFASVVSYRDTGISNEGFLEQERLKQAYSNVDVNMQGRILELLHYFGVCIPIDGTNMELFPSKLPMGEPDETVWPKAPEAGQRQLTYSVTFPSLIPPPLFSDLIVSVYRRRADSTTMSRHSRYFANRILDCMPLDVIGCRDCGFETNNNIHEDLLLHKVLFELVPHRRTIFMTVRGSNPCCMMKRINSLLNKVVGKYEGLGTLELDTIICSGCYMQSVEGAHRFSAKLLFAETGSKEKITCVRNHVLPNASAILTGGIHQSCLPYATIKPIKAREHLDFTGCPKLFIVLPVNQDGLSFERDERLFASSLLFDGYAAHLLCEFPDGYHITRAAGYRLKNPDKFMKLFGVQVVAVLHLLSHMVESSVLSFEYASQTKALSSRVTELIKDYQTKFSVKDIDPNVNLQELSHQINERGEKFQRDDLRTCLHIIDQPTTFGPLRRLQYLDQKLWVCNDHYRQLRVLSGGLRGATENAATKA